MHMSKNKKKDFNGRILKMGDIVRYEKGYIWQIIQFVKPKKKVICKISSVLIPLTPTERKYMAKYCVIEKFVEKVEYISKDEVILYKLEN